MRLRQSHLFPFLEQKKKRRRRSASIAQPEGALAVLLFVFSLFSVRNAGAVCGSHVNLTHSLPVSGGFNIFVRTFGCASGAPILFLHGGWGPLPGGDSSSAAGLVDT
jgi:hypothetical protein